MPAPAGPGRRHAGRTGATAPLHPTAARALPTAERRYRWALAAALGALLTWSVVVLLVLDPAETATSDLPGLYDSLTAGQVASLVGMTTVWCLASVAALVMGLLLVTLSGRLARGRPRSTARVLVRAAVALGVLGGVAMSTALVGFPVGLGFYSQAERLGTAPPAASMSGELAVTTTAGLLAVVVALVLGVVAAVQLALSGPGEAR